MSVDFLNRHDQIINNFLENRPTWKRHQLRKELNKSFFEPAPVLYYIPDAFEVNQSTNTLHLLEVDGSSGTSPRKIQNMIDLWWHIDAEEWFMTLTSISVYSGATSFMDDSDFCTIALSRMYDRHLSLASA